MKNLNDILDRVEIALAELRDRPDNFVILVEGKKDVDALHELGIYGEIIKIQSASKGIFAITEDLSKERKEAYILTDWDRKGGQLALLLKNALGANGIAYHENVRSELSKLCRSEIKDVESLPAYISLLKSRL